MSGGNNPRKFSEKIALHNQKQAEETAAFEQIMKEVGQTKNVTTGIPAGGGQTNMMPMPMPNKTKQTQQNLIPITSSMNCRSLPNVHQMSSHHDKGTQGSHYSQKMGSPRASRGSSIGPVKTNRSRTDHSPYASPPNQSMLSSSMNAGNSSGSNLYSQSMYQNSPYLGLPSDGPWRRANSDSALHSLIIPSVVPDSSEESNNSNNSNDPRDYFGGMGGHSPKHTNDLPSVIPNTVGDGPNLLEIPNSVSTGSLPDLTNFQFSTQIQQSIDPEESQLTNSPYSTSPLSLTYSPTGGSPNPPSHSNNHHQQQQQQQQQGTNNPRSPHGYQQHPSQQQQQQQSNQQTQQQSMLDNSANMNSFQNFTQADNNMLTAYRNPQRPSPQSSPLPFRSPSPLDGQLSAPPSPGAGPQTMSNTPDSYYLSQQAHALQQHFEQISMGSPAPHRNSSNWQQGGGMVNNYPYNYANTSQAQIQTGATAGISSQQSPQHHNQPQTPQTPSSIPDIIFTEFSDELLASEAAAQALREGLGSLDMEGFNMLADPDLVQLDPQAEDSFRLDRL